VTRQPHVARRAEELLGTAVAATAPVAGGDIATATKIVSYTPSGSFGSAGATRDPRQAQFGFKITF